MLPYKGTFTKSNLSSTASSNSLASFLGENWATLLIMDVKMEARVTTTFSI